MFIFSLFHHLLVPRDRDFCHFLFPLQNFWVKRQKCKGPIQIAYQSSGIGAINAEEGHRRLDILGRGGIGSQAIEGGSARNGELLGGGTEAGAGKSSGEHGGRDGDKASKEWRIEVARREGTQWPLRNDSRRRLKRVRTSASCGVTWQHVPQAPKSAFLFRLHPFT